MWQRSPLYSLHKWKWDTHRPTCTIYSSILGYSELDVTCYLLLTYAVMLSQYGIFILFRLSWLWLLGSQFTLRLISHTHTNIKLSFQFKVSSLPFLGFFSGWLSRQRKQITWSQRRVHIFIFTKQHKIQSKRTDASSWPWTVLTMNETP